MVDHGKVTDNMLDAMNVQAEHLATARQAIRKARTLIEGFALTDPTLWPILSEIDPALSRG